MSDTPSGGKGPHEVFKEIEDLAAEVEQGLADLTKQLSDVAVLSLQRWTGRAASNVDECFLRVHEKKGLPESCMAWLLINGFRVLSFTPEEVRGRQALMLWRSKLRDLPVPGNDHCTLALSTGYDFKVRNVGHNIGGAECRFQLVQ
ncbi:MAG: hypothetical protein D6675_01900 [Gemmatimonadetes bacterium]|nr:MAG: hypothetical protein D6675_01900 [Gemmatimonadota bacterium]